MTQRNQYTQLSFWQEPEQQSLWTDEELDNLPVEWPMKPLAEVRQIVQLELPFEYEDETVG